MEEWKDVFSREVEHLGAHLKALVKWGIIACAVGLGVGIVGVAFHLAIGWATELRVAHGWLLYLLPLVGISIVGIYHMGGIHEDKGTNLVINAVRGETPMAFRTAPLIFIASTLTHLCGGSSGREGAALQLGGSIACSVGQWLGFKQEDRRILVVCGMASAFSALFGTPLTSAVFAMEVVHVGVMHYAALVPATLSALVAALLAKSLGLAPTAYSVAQVPGLSALSLVQTVALGVLCALVAILFCQCMHVAHDFYQRFLPNPYLRAAAGGAIVVLLTLLVGTRDYNGAGGEVIAAAVAGFTVPPAFLLKMLFTALTLGAGYKGGEIVPVFFTGATFGCLVGPFLGLPSSFAAAAGMAAVFCGVTNCPMASLILAYELFGGQGLGMYAVVCAVSYLVSGYGGLYSAQEIVYSKIRPELYVRK